MERGSQKRFAMKDHQTFGRALVGASVLLAGCAADVTRSDPAPTAVVESVAQSSSALRTESAGEHCSPYACCFPSGGGGWQDNPLEDDLRRIACTPPSPYQQTKDQFWVWTRCPLRFETFEAVWKFRATPYDAHFVENACLGFVPDSVVVVFDPTCGTCGPQQQ
jgi:hypothetical protein